MAKRGLCLLLAVAAVLSLCVPAFAEEEVVTTEEPVVTEEVVVTEEPAEEPEVEEPGAEPVTAAATSGQCGYDGTDVRWSFDGSTLTISGTGPMWDYDSNQYLGATDAPWATYLSSVKNVVIQNGVTSIG